jgi:hypothetical protein
LAVAQKMRQTSGTIFSVFSTLSGWKPSPRKMMKLWPVPRAVAFILASSVMLGSVPVQRTSRKRRTKQ